MQLDTRVSDKWASMGPRLVSRGDGMFKFSDGESNGASMGPRLVSRGDWKHLPIYNTR